MASCCSDPKVRGGRCDNCGTWLEDLGPSLTDELRDFEASLSGKDLKVFKKAYQEARERLGGRESLALAKIALDNSRAAR